jgi:hypothetical protein
MLRKNDFCAVSWLTTIVLPYEIFFSAISVVNTQKEICKIGVSDRVVMVIDFEPHAPQRCMFEPTARA